VIIRNAGDAYIVNNFAKSTVRDDHHNGPIRDDVDEFAMRIMMEECYESAEASEKEIEKELKEKQED